MALEVKRSRQGLEPLRIDGILCLPCGTFLQGVSSQI